MREYRGWGDYTTRKRFHDAEYTGMVIRDSKMLVGCTLCRYGAAAPVVQVSWTVPQVIKDGEKFELIDKELDMRNCHICVSRLQDAIDEQW